MSNKKNKKKSKSKKNRYPKHLTSNNYNPELDLRLITGGWQNLTIKKFLGLAKSEMDIKNHLYRFLTYKGLHDEYSKGLWEKEYDKM